MSPNSISILVHRIFGSIPFLFEKSFQTRANRDIYDENLGLFVFDVQKQIEILQTMLKHHFRDIFSLLAWVKRQHRPHIQKQIS